MTANDSVHLSLGDVRSLCVSTLSARGLHPDHCEAVAQTIVAGERDGCASHGIYRLLIATRSVSSGLVALDANPEVWASSPAIVTVDGDGGFAQLAFEMGLPELVARARMNGLAALTLKNVVHFAALWPEVERVTEAGLVAIALTANHACVAPAGGTRPVFGTNPFAFGWPRPGRDPLVFDFATSVIARGDIELHHREGKPVPKDWGYDAEGQLTTDAAAVLDGAMRTFGGHKGSALAMMVELLAGPLIGDVTSAEALAVDAGRSGSPVGGELIIALDPAGFLGDEAEKHMARAERIFNDIERQGARLPSSRRYAARRRSVASGVDIPRTLYDEIMALGQ